MSELGLGCVKTQTLNLRVEFSMSIAILRHKRKLARSNGMSGCTPQS